jgi:hypothetical protein
MLPVRCDSAKGQPRFDGIEIKLQLVMGMLRPSTFRIPFSVAEPLSGVLVNSEFSARVIL